MSVHERAGTVTLGVRRFETYGGSPSVGFRTVDGSAVAGRDYVAKRGTLVFGPEEQTKTLSVALLNSPGVPGKLGFKVVLDNLSSGASFAGPTEAWVTVVEDDSPVAAMVEVAGQPGVATAEEAQGGVTVAVVRSGPTDLPLAVRYFTTDDTAKAGADYVAQDGVLVFGAGETLKTITVPLSNDRVPETEEAFYLRLSDLPEGAVVGPWRLALIQVHDDDAPAELDPQFRPGSGLDDRVRSMTLQPDGRLLVAGDFNFADGVRRDEVARFHPDGSLDLTFDPGPTLRGRLGLGGLALALQPDGKVLVGGDFNDTTDMRQPMLVRLNPNGQPDPTFVPTTSNQFRVRAIAAQDDGKIVIGGTFYSADGEQLNLARLYGDGSPDPTFVISDGTPNGGTPAGRALYGEVLALALQPDGKILLAGNFIRFGTLSRPHVARVNPDGTLDATFDPGGGADKDIGSIILQPDGKILVAGEFSHFGGYPRWRIVRLNADGSVDTTFAPSPGANREIHAMALQPNGQILVGGEFTEVNTVSRGRLARLNADGSLDLDFNPGAGANEEVRTLAVASDGVFVGGDFTLFHRVGLNRFARLLLAPAATDTVSLMLGNYAVREDTGSARITVRRQGQSAAPLTVEYATTPGTAGADEFEPQAGSLTFGPLESEKTMSIPLHDDPVVEDVKTFTVELRNPTGGLLGTHVEASVRLLDNEAPTVLDPTFVPPMLMPEVDALALQPDGGLLVGGAFGIEYPGYTLLSRCLARLHADGAVDTNFFPALVGAPVRTILVLPGGQIVVGGRMEPNRLVRLQASGDLDASFAAPAFDDEVRVVVRSGADQLLVGGEFTHIGGVGRKRIARLNHDGSLDLAFDPGSGANDQVLAIQEQSDRRVLIGGRFTKVDGARRTYLARLLADGQLDPSFNAVLNDRVRGIALLPDGGLLVGGRFTQVGGAGRLYLARLNADGSLDASFNPAAIDEEVRSVALLADGRIVIAGEFSTVGGCSRNRVARLNPDGSLDALFQPGSGADATVWTALPLADGRIVIGGEFYAVAGVSRPAVARLNAEQPPGLEAMSAAGGFGLRLYGVPSQTYALAASTNLTNWETVATRQLTAPIAEWLDPDAARYSSRFYRAWRVGE